METLQTLGILVALIIGFAWYLKNRQKDLAKEGTVLEMKQKSQEVEIVKQKEELAQIPEQQKELTSDNVINFWDKKK